jgi:hypothetical protein
MLDSKRREFIALIGGGGLLLAVKVKRARGQQAAMPVVGLLSGRSPNDSGANVVAFQRVLVVVAKAENIRLLCWLYLKSDHFVGGGSGRP